MGTLNRPHHGGGKKISNRGQLLQVETLIQFILISWGALGGSLLAKTMENK